MGVFLLVLVVALVVTVVRRRGRTKRLPTLMHDYSDHRGVYQRWPGRSRRRFK
jgi:hypothetical protein